MNRLTLLHAVRVSLTVATILWSCITAIHAAEVLVPHPMIERTSSPLTKQLGDFGESFVGAGLRARGFQVVNGNIGGTGIDWIPVKRASSGRIVDLRFVEVKTRQNRRVVL